MVTTERILKRRVYYRKWYSENKDRMKTYDKKRSISPQRRALQKIYRKQWVVKNKDKAKIINARYVSKNKIRISERMKQYHSNLRLKLFEILGGTKCIGCGEIDISKLRFDHKNGGGVREYKYFGRPATLYRYYIKHPDEAKNKLQPLCDDCNILKGILTAEEFLVILDIRKTKKQRTTRDILEFC